MLRSGIITTLCIAAICGCATNSGKRGDSVPHKPYGQLDMVILAVDNLRKAASFYDAAFRWPRRIDLPTLVEFELPDGRGLAVFQRENFANNTGRLPPQPESTTATELYFRCDDLDACINRLIGAGAQPLAEKQLKPWGDEAAYFADPDGNVIVVAHKADGDAIAADNPSIVIERKSLVYAPIAEVFAAWTTEAGVRTFFAPDAHITLEPGGPYEMIFMPDAPAGSRGAEGCTVIEFTPPSHFAFTWGFPPSIPALRGQYLTRVDIWLESVDADITELRMVHSGWQTGHQWFRGLAYFEQAWDLVLRRLNHRFRFGPVDWENPPLPLPSTAPQP